MKLVKEDKGYQRCVETGINHPDGEKNTEFRFKRKSGGIYFNYPSINDPDLDEEGCIEPSSPELQDRINKMTNFEIASEVIDAIKQIYSNQGDRMLNMTTTVNYEEEA